MDENSLSKAVIGAAIEVHRALGPGLLESTYEACMCRELRIRGIEYSQQDSVRVMYKGIAIEEKFRTDIVVEKRVVIEIKAVEKLAPIHRAQVLTYLRLTGLKLGLLINFHSNQLRDGIERVVNNL